MTAELGHSSSLLCFGEQAIDVVVDRNQLSASLRTSPSIATMLYSAGVIHYWDAFNVYYYLEKKKVENFDRITIDKVQQQKKNTHDNTVTQWISNEQSTVWKV